MNNKTMVARRERRQGCQVKNQEGTGGGRRYNRDQDNLKKESHTKLRGQKVKVSKKEF